MVRHGRDDVAGRERDALSVYATRVQTILFVVLSFLQPGPHAVGVRIDDATAVWYPAKAGGEVMRFRDYVPRLEDVDMFLHAKKVSDEAIVELFDTRMTARRDAPEKKGRFPVVVIARGNLTDHAVLAEHIASHGYVVALSSRAGARVIDVPEALTSWAFAAVKLPELRNVTSATKADVEREAGRVMRSLRR